MSPFGVERHPGPGDAGAGLRPKGAASVRALLYIDPRALTFVPEADGRRVAKADVMGIVFNESGAPTTGRTARLHRRYRSRCGAPEPRFGHRLLDGRPRAEARRLSGAVRCARRDVRCAGGRGRVRGHPRREKGHVRALRRRAGRGESAKRATPDDWERDAWRAVSSPALRVFEPGARLVYTYEIYNAAVARRNARHRLARRQAVFQRAALDAGRLHRRSRPMKAAGGIKLGDRMPAGDYVFQVTATTRGPGRGKPKSATRWTSFEVRANP